MKITWNVRNQIWVNIQREKVKRERILLRFLSSPPSSPPASPSSSSSSSKSNAKKHVHKHKNEMPLVKLDVKFELPIYDGEVNAERLDNWVW
jgi:hypothetical protein